MAQPPVWRLNVLRTAYAFVGVGLAFTIWPSLVSHPLQWPLMNGVVASLLAAVSVLALLGLRHPLQMLPILLFEIIWKAIWLGFVALPLWRADRVDPRTFQTVLECLATIVVVVAIPWRHVVALYVLQPGLPWRGSARNGVNRGQASEPSASTPSIS